MCKSLDKVTIIFTIITIAYVRYSSGRSHEYVNALTDEFIDKINSMQSDWVAGHNFPPGTKFSQLKHLFGADRETFPETEQLNIKTNKTIPIKFDSRLEWTKCTKISSVKNQGNCGNCWAVAAATTMSDRLCISTKGKFLSDISAQQATSCISGEGCNSGTTYGAWNYFIHSGLITGGDYNSLEGCQPYTLPPCNHTGIGPNLVSCQAPISSTPKCLSKSCSNKKYHLSYDQDLHKGKNVYVIKNNVKDTQTHIQQFGPVVADFELYEDFLAYKSGIYQHVKGSKLGAHAIRILGWGTESGKDYWLVANSWGPDWGWGGLVKFKRGTNECGIEDNIVSGITG